jgi:hypothetical protein
VCSELVLGYIDDIAVGGEAMYLSKDFLNLEAAGEKVDPELNRSKYEVTGHTVVTPAMFKSYGINRPENSASEVIFLVAPLLAGPHLDSVLERKSLEPRQLSQRLELTSAVPRLFVSCTVNCHFI